MHGNASKHEWQSMHGQWQMHVKISCMANHVCPTMYVNHELSSETGRLDELMIKIRALVEDIHGRYLVQPGAMQTWADFTK